jgi:uncharacterized protein
LRIASRPRLHPILSPWAGDPSVGEPEVGAGPSADRGQRRRRRDRRRSLAHRPTGVSWSEMEALDRIKADLGGAMRAGEKQKVGALRLVMSELQKAAKEGSDDELAVLRRERKRRQEAARAYRDAGRSDLATVEDSEAELISGYLPAELPEEELRAIVERAVRESGAESAKDMGAAMKQAMAAVDGRADGKRVSGLVRASLQG